MMEWIFSVTSIDSLGYPGTRNISVRNIGTDEQARRAIVHHILATGGRVLKIREPEMPLEPLYVIGRKKHDDLS